MHDWGEMFTHKLHSGYLCEMFVWEPLGESCCHRIGWKEGDGEREEGKGREGEQRSGQTLVTEGEAFGSVKTGSERAERVRNQRIWPFKSPIQRIRRWVWRYSGIFVIIVTRLCASTNSASRHRGRLQWRGDSSVSRIRISPTLCRQRGWGGPGTGSVEDFLQLDWTLRTHKPQV